MLYHSMLEFIYKTSLLLIFHATEFGGCTQNTKGVCAAHLGGYTYTINHVNSGTIMIGGITYSNILRAPCVILLFSILSSGMNSGSNA